MNVFFIEFLNASSYGDPFIFQVSLSTLVTLHNKYIRSKDVKNILERYALMREMIKVSPDLFRRPPTYDVTNLPMGLPINDPLTREGK